MARLAENQNSHKPSIWDDSPYVRFQRDEIKEEEANAQEEERKKEEEEENNQNDVILQRRMVDAMRQVHNNELPLVIPSEPPPGYFGKFIVETTADNVDTHFYEDGSFVKDTTLSQAMDIVTIDSATSIHNEDVKQQSKLGAQFMDNVTKVPLSDFWHFLTQVFAVVIFVTNVISSIYDLIREPKNLHYKVPNILIGIVATGLIYLWFDLLQKGKKHGEGKQKYVEGENENKEGNTGEDLKEEELGGKHGEGKPEVTGERDESEEDGNMENEEAVRKENNAEEEEEDMDESEETEEEGDMEKDEDKNKENEGQNEEKEKEGHRNKEKEENMGEEQKKEDNNVEKKKRKKKKDNNEEKEEEGPTDEHIKKEEDKKEEGKEVEENEEKEKEKVEGNEEKEKKKVEENEEREKEEKDEKTEEGLKEDDKKKKYQQYIENILHEVVLYPIIVLNVFGFATDVIEDKWFGKVQFFLIIIDALDISWTQIMRIYMIHRFLRDISDKLGAHANIGWKILFRGIFTTVSNFVLFVFVILLLGVQVHSDNYCITHDSNSSINYNKWCGNMTIDSTTRKYSGSVNSTFLVIAVVFLPLFNLIMFVAVNYHWVIELLLQLGEHSLKEIGEETENKTGSNKHASKDPSNKLDENLGLVVHLVQDSKKINDKLDAMRNVHSFKRFISVATEPVIAAMILVWEVILVLAIVHFDGCEPSSFTSWCNRGGVQAIFVVVAVVSNIHAVAVALLFNAGIVVVFMAFLVYPVSVPFFLRRIAP